jgi:hypothetical protein
MADDDPNANDRRDGGELSTDPAEDDGRPIGPAEDAERTPDSDPPLADLARRVARRRRTDGADSPPSLEDRRIGGPEDGPDDSAATEVDAGSDGRPEAPLSGLARRVSTRREHRDSEEASTSVFEEMDVGEVDSDTLWTTLVESDPEPEVRVGTGATATPADEGVPGYTDHLVSKTEFCQKCPYLADPPDLRCEHDGTEIVEVPDAERFRVRNCPMAGDDDL